MRFVSHTLLPLAICVFLIIECFAHIDLHQAQTLYAMTAGMILPLTGVHAWVAIRHLFWGRQ